MKKILFATTNEGKIREAREFLEIDVVSASLEVEEIQSLDPIKVAIKKAEEYYKVLRKPVLVEDVSLVFKSLGKLPGTYINDFLDSLGNLGLVGLLDNKDNKAVAQTTLVFKDKDCVRTFVGITKGVISDKPRGKNGFGWDRIFIPNRNTKTFAQMSLEQKNKFSMRVKAFKKLKKWLVELDS